MVKVCNKMTDDSPSPSATVANDTTAAVIPKNDDESSPSSANIVKSSLATKANQGPSSTPSSPPCLSSFIVRLKLDISNAIIDTSSPLVDSITSSLLSVDGIVSINVDLVLESTVTINLSNTNPNLDLFSVVVALDKIGIRGYLLPPTTTTIQDSQVAPSIPDDDDDITVVVIGHKTTMSIPPPTLPQTTVNNDSTKQQKQQSSSRLQPHMISTLMNELRNGSLPLPQLETQRRYSCGCRCVGCVGSSTRVKPNDGGRDVLLWPLSDRMAMNDENGDGGGGCCRRGGQRDSRNMEEMKDCDGQCTGDNNKEGEVIGKQQQETVKLV